MRRMSLKRDDVAANAPTTGSLTSDDGALALRTMECSADGSQSVDGKHKRIDAGVYPCRRAVHHPGTPKEYKCWEICDVPGRSCIHIHVANKADQLEGCVAPGEGVTNDGQAVEHSQAAFDTLESFTAGWTEWELEILDP